MRAGFQYLLILMMTLVLSLPVVVRAQAASEVSIREVLTLGTASGVAESEASELVEQTVEDVSVQESAEKIKISVGRSGSFELLSIPNDPEKTRGFSGLSSEKQEAFKTRRLSFIKQVAQVIHSTKFVLGAGSLIGKSFTFLKNKIKKPAAEASATPAAAEAFRQRSHRLGQALLTAIDGQLWTQAPLMVNSNEYGISISASIIAIAGVLKNGGGGIQDLGISFAYNKDKKALVFEFFHNSEKFKLGEPFAAVLGVAPKVGLTVVQRVEGVEGMILRGTSHGVPVLPSTVAIGENNFTLNGVFTIGLPPSPIADILPGFGTDFTKETLFRLSVSPLVKGFVRIEMGNLKGEMRAIRDTFASVWNKLSGKVTSRRTAARMCSAVF